jgi:hypothetical protein
LDFQKIESITSKLNSYKSICICIFGVNYWSVIRNYFNSQLIKGTFKKCDIDTNLSKLLLNPFVFIDLFQILFFFITIKLRACINNRVDFLFTSELNDLYLDTYNNKKFSRYKDPYFLRFRKRLKCHKLYITEESVSRFYISGSTISPRKLYKWKNTILFFIRLVYYKEIRFFYKNLTLAKKDNNYFETLFNQNLLDEINEIFFWHVVFIIIFKAYSPKYIITSCYFISASNYGIIAACRTLNIKSIEIQHGCVTNHYTNWPSDFPQTIIPDYFLTWNKHQSLILNSKDTFIKSLTGVNEWVYFQNKNFTKNYNFQVDSINIVYIHQYLDHEWNTIKIRSILSNLSNKHHLYYVFHPLTNSGSKKTIKNYFSNYSQITFFDSENVNIYDLISNSDCCFTRYSASAIEANCLNKKLLLVDRHSLYYYQNEINQDLHIYLEDLSGIIEFLNSIIKDDPRLIIKSDLSSSNFEFLEQLDLI